MAVMTALAIAGGLAKFIPAVSHFFDGDSTDESVVDKVVNIAETLTGKKGGDAITAINSDPSIALKFKKAVMANAHIESRLEIDRMRIVNKTMQIEAKSNKWWVSGWRPFIGFVTGFAFVICVGFVCFLTYVAINSSNQDAMQMIPQVIFNFTTLFGIPGAILGIASHHRGREKRDKK